MNATVHYLHHSATFVETASEWVLTLPTGKKLPLTPIEAEAKLIHSSPQSSTLKGQFLLEGVRCSMVITRTDTTDYIWLKHKNTAYTWSQNRYSKKSKRRQIDTYNNDKHNGSLLATMPGSIVSIAVQQGDVVSEGQLLVIMESMKMELSLNSAISGIVSEINVTTGDKVTIGQKLITVVPSQN
ncbi:MAG: acetyl-CoA carboxylase biotin carboxyl carrier protein subunit [Vampirovibrionales bacterium]